ncbi:lipopolysaccharide biosynthesis protein [Bradyrhizobium sp. UFLA05-112]
MKDLKERAVRGGLARLCGQAANLVLRLSFMMIMARLLDPEEFGLVAMATILTGFFEIFRTAGLSSATIQKASITGEQISTLFWINILVGTVLCLLCSATAPVLVSFYHEPRLFWVTVTLSVGFVFSAGGVQHSALLQRQLRYVALAIAETLSLLASFALGLIMACGAFGYWALVVSTIAAPAINTALMWASTGWMPGMPRRNAGIYQMLRFGGTITLNNLVMYFAYNLDKLLLGRFWGADALGLYGRAYQLINVPTSNLHAAVGGVVFSAISRLHDDPVRLRNYFLKGYSLVSSLTVPVSVFAAFFADDIVLVALGPKWTDATTMFRLLTPTIFVLGVINPTGWLIQSVGLQVRSLRIAFVIAPLVMTAYLIGLPYGPNGVALAFSAAMTVWLVPHVFWSLHNTVVSPWDVLLATCRPFLASVVAAAFALGIEFYMMNLGYLQSPLLRLLMVSVVMVIFYLVIFLFALGQKTLYFDLLRGLKGSTPSAKTPTEAGFMESETTNKHLCT